METPSWVKHFDGGIKHQLPPQPSVSPEYSGSLWNMSGGLLDTPKRYPSSQSLNFKPETMPHSSGEHISRVRNVQSAVTLSEEEKRTKKRRRRRQVDDTSGYSTTSELSEFELPRRRIDRPTRPIELTVHTGNNRRESIQDDRSDRCKNIHDDRSERSRTSKVSQTTRKSESDISKTPPSRKVSDGSKSTPSRIDVTRVGERLPRTRSQAESVGSVPSVRSNHTNRSNQTNRTTQSKTQSNCITIRKDIVSGSGELLDPFSFIQPVSEPFSRKVRKVMGPLFGIILMLILAASLGAAIYFAVELKKTQEDEIQMLRASLALRIKNTGYSQDLDRLTQSDFNSLSLSYCQQMDTFYQSSHFKSTYRGCDVISFKNGLINFTLFFLEKDASKKEIISVIQTSAPKVENSEQNVAVVDKFEIELENAKIKIEHETTPVNFNKIKKKQTVNVTTKPKTVSTSVQSVVTTSAQTSTSLPVTMAPKRSTTTDQSGMKSTTGSSADPTPSELAWEPCAHKDGAFFPHPMECNLYFQCEHKKSLLQRCVGDLVFDQDSVVCIPDRPGLKCPDPSTAPPKPPSVANDTVVKVTNVDPTPVETTKPKIRNNTVISSLYPSRPPYDPDPCQTGQPGELYPHPADCYRFIQCIGGKKGVVQKCATSLVYDPKTMTCIFPKNELVCPDLLPCEGISRGYYPHPRNCTQYIQCDAERVIIQTCAPGLVWDPTINSCVFRTSNSICPEAIITTTKSPKT